ncbi:hypothetical protein Tco_1467438 [Tanacetum coccineum]
MNVFMRISFGSTIKLVSFDESQVVTFNGKFVSGFRNSDCGTRSQSDNMVGNPHGFIIYWIVISKNIKKVTGVIDVENRLIDNSRMLRWILSLIEWNSFVSSTKFLIQSTLRLGVINGGLVPLGDNRTCTIKGTKKVKIQLHDGSSFILKDVRYVTWLRRSLISLDTLEKKGYNVKMQMGRINVIKGCWVMMTGIRFKQLGPGVDTGVHRVHVEKRVWFEVELQGALRDHEAEVFQVSNDDAVVAQRWLEDKQLKEKKNTDCLVKEQ